MTGEEWALAASVVFSGLWSGLLGMLTLVMHPMLAAMDGGDFGALLASVPSGCRKAWFNYACAIGMAVAPIVALVTLWDDPSSAPFVLTAIGLAVVIVGVYVVSNAWKEPHYDVMLAWDPEAMPAESGGGTAALPRAQLGPSGGDLDGVRPVLGGSGRPLGRGSAGPGVLQHPRVRAPGLRRSK